MDVLLDILGIMAVLFIFWFIPTVLGLTGIMKIAAYLFEFFIFEVIHDGIKKGE